MRSRKWVQWIKDDRAYTFPLMMTFVTLTFGVILLLILLWIGATMAAYQALMNAANSAAMAGQSQMNSQTAMTNEGFGSTGWLLNSSQAQSVSQTLWQQAILNEHLNRAFANLQETTSLQGNEVIVQASGVFQPMFLNPLLAVFPQLAQNAGIPMQVTVKQEYYVAGE